MSPEAGGDERVSGQSRRSCSSSQSSTFLCVPRLQSLFVRPAFSFYLLAFIFLFNWWRDRLQTWAGWTLCDGCCVVKCAPAAMLHQHICSCIFICSRSFCTSQTGTHGWSQTFAQALVCPFLTSYAAQKSLVAHLAFKHRNT